MSAVVHVFTNEKYRHSGRENDKAQAKLREVERIAHSVRQEVHYIWVKFRADNDTNALPALVEQLRAEFREIEPGSSLVTLMGDGGTGTFLRAKQLIDQEFPERSKDRLFLAPGGTMNLIAQALGVELCHLEAFLRGDNSVEAVIVRELLVKKLSSGEISFPWVAFAGVGLDAGVLELYDGKSRDNHVLTNVGLAAFELAPSVLFSPEKFVWDMAFAVRQLGLMCFNAKYDGVGAKDFYRVQLGPVSGRKAAAKGVMLQVAGIHPAISDFYWENGDWSQLLDILPGHPRWRKFMESIRPRISTSEHRSHAIDGPFTCHLDGFPHRLPQGVADYDFRSLDAPPVRVYARRTDSHVVL